MKKIEKIEKSSHTKKLFLHKNEKKQTTLKTPRSKKKWYDKTKSGEGDGFENRDYELTFTFDFRFQNFIKFIKFQDLEKISKNFKKKSKVQNHLGMLI